jgi:hypothetical protein
MKLLPHYFKWIGIGLFFASMLLGIDDIQRGYLDGSNTNTINDFNQLLPEICSQLSDYILLLSLLLYILAKNKTEDEFAQKLRYESAFIVLIGTILTVFIIYLFNTEFVIKPSTFLALQMIGYLIVRLLKRRVILGGDHEEQS